MIVESTIADNTVFYESILVVHKFRLSPDDFRKNRLLPGKAEALSCRSQLNVLLCTVKVEQIVNHLNACFIPSGFNSTFGLKSQILTIYVPFSRNVYVQNVLAHDSSVEVEVVFYIVILYTYNIFTVISDLFSIIGINNLAAVFNDFGRYYIDSVYISIQMSGSVSVVVAPVFTFRFNLKFITGASNEYHT